MPLKADPTKIHIVQRGMGETMLRLRQPPVRHTLHFGQRGGEALRGRNLAALWALCPASPDIGASDLPRRFRTEFAKTASSSLTFYSFIPMCKFSNVP